MNVKSALFPQPCLKMHQLPSNIQIILAAALLAVIHVPLSIVCVDDARYLMCNTRFECGNISGFGYPFWMDGREAYCGYPGDQFKLSCSGDSSPEITMPGDDAYHILKLDNSIKALTLARKDYPSTLCLSSIGNVTLNYTAFRYASDNTNFTFYYRCETTLPATAFPAPTLEFNFTSTQLDCGDGASYFSTRNASEIAAALGNAEAASSIESYLDRCQERVMMPLYASAAAPLKTGTATPDQVVAAINNGFGVKWSAENDLCDACVNSGGVCGHDTDSASGEFTCYCKDKPHSTTCSTGGGKRQVSLVIGIAIGGAGIFGLLLGFGAYFVIQRKRRIVAETISKDLSVPTDTIPPSTNSLTTSTTNFSRSNPSYPSSKSDLERGSTYFGVQVFSYTELEEATDNFDSSKELGDGGFGVVYYGVLRDGRVVAVKRLFENNFKRVEQFMNEVEILTRLRHPNLVTLFGCTSRRSRELLLVYEYISNGTVADHLHGKQAETGLLSWPNRLKIAVETADALAYLHASEIIHRDVKTNNILLDDNFCVKVADFGLSRLFPSDVTHVSTAPQGTPGYVDPEYYQCYQLTAKSDVYSFGVVLTELLSSKPAVDTSRHRLDINLANMAVNKIQNQALHELVDPCLGFDKDEDVRRGATSVAELAFRCLQQERDMRPSMNEVLGVLRGIQNEELDDNDNDTAADDIGLLKSKPPPVSPDTDKWVSSSSTSSL